MAKNRVEPPRGGRGNVGGGSVRKAQKKNASVGKLYGILGIVAVLGIMAIVFVANRPKAGPRAIDPNLPPAKAEGYVLGSPTAPVEIIEFADFECPACGNYATITGPDVKKRLVETGQARLRFYDFPLPIHANVWPAHLAAACANDQGKFWEMHDRIFQGQPDWNGQATRNPEKVLRGYAEALGLNMQTYNECVESERHRARIQANLDEGIRLGVNSTPSFIIGGQLVPGGLSYDAIKKYVDDAAAKARAVPGAATTDTAARTTVPATGAAGTGR